MTVELRAISAEELPAFARASSIGFGESDAWFEREKEWVSIALDRTCAGFEGPDMVCTSRSYAFEITVPGGATLPAGGVSAVTVLPTHRVLTTPLPDAAEIKALIEGVCEVEEFPFHDGTEPDIRARFLRTLRVRGEQAHVFGLVQRGVRAYWVLVLRPELSS